MDIQTTFLWHLLSLSIHFISLLFCLSYPIFDVLKIWHRLLFFTNFNQLWLVIFYIIVVVQDIQKIKKREIPSYSGMTHQLHQLMIFTGLFVTLIFWSVYVISKDVFLSKHTQDLLPLWLLVLFHGGGLFSMLVEIRFLPESQVNTQPIMWDIMGGMNIGMVFINYLFVGKFVYPIQKLLPFYVNVVAFFLFFCIVRFFFKKFLCLQQEIQNTPKQIIIKKKYDQNETQLYDLKNQQIVTTAQNSKSD